MTGVSVLSRQVTGNLLYTTKGIYSLMLLKGKKCRVGCRDS